MKHVVIPIPNEILENVLCSQQSKIKFHNQTSVCVCMLMSMQYQFYSSANKMNAQAVCSQQNNNFCLKFVQSNGLPSNN